MQPQTATYAKRSINGSCQTGFELCATRSCTGASLGSHVRVGLEDSLWDGPGKLAQKNADQVKRVRDILEGLSLEVATSDEARQMLNLKGKDKTNIV